MKINFYLNLDTFSFFVEHFVAFWRLEYFWINWEIQVLNTNHKSCFKQKQLKTWKIKNIRETRMWYLINKFNITEYAKNLAEISKNCLETRKKHQNNQISKNIKFSLIKLQQIPKKFFVSNCWENSEKLNKTK